MELKAAVSKCRSPGETPLCPGLAGMLSSTGMRELPCVPRVLKKDSKLLAWFLPSLYLFVGYLFVDYLCPVFASLLIKAYANPGVGF